MKQYKALKLAIHFFKTEDVLVTSEPGVFEGVNNLDPNSSSSWFNFGGANNEN